MRACLPVERPTKHYTTLLARAHGFQHGSIPFVAGNDAIEFLELFHSFDGHTQFLDFKSSRVVNHIAFCFGPRVVAGEAVLRVYGGRQVVHFVAGWNCTFKTIGVSHGPLEFDWKFARLLGLQNPGRFAAHYSWSQQEQVAGILGVAVRLKRVGKAERLIGVLKVKDSGMRDAKTRERTGEQTFDWLDPVDVLGYGTQSPPFG